jgi:Reverse transcriptase (RNA-dependent DNA polymerase)
LDNVLAAYEIIHYSKIHKEKYLVLKVDFEKAYDNVNWNFIREMLIRRGFGNKWVTWIMNLLHGAQTYININGIPTQFFQCKRGLRQGDPLSPFLFYLVTDTLCQIMNRDTDLNLIQGLGPRLSIGHKCSHFLYADDTIFFLPTDSDIIENVK